MSRYVKPAPTKLDTVEAAADAVLNFYHNKVKAMLKQDRMAVARRLMAMFEVAGTEYVDCHNQERN